MRTALATAIEACRITDGDYATPPNSGPTGAFFISHAPTAPMFCIASDGSDWTQCGFFGRAWEHVSVSLPGLDYTPRWEDMAFVKLAFWMDDETVIQIHPPKSCYVNYHPACLHLWRPIGFMIPLPPIETLAPCIGKSENPPLRKAIAVDEHRKQSRRRTRRAKSARRGSR